MKDPKYVTPKQANWFAKVREGIEKDTGKSIDEWVVIARSCPETSKRKQSVMENSRTTENVRCGCRICAITG